MDEQAAVTVEEAIYTTRSMRRLRDEPVPEEELRFLVESAVQAPTGSNQQRWAFVVVTDREQIRKVGEVYREAGRAIMPAIMEGGTLDEATEKIYRRAMLLVDGMVDVPALILCCMRGPFPSEPAMATAYFGSIFPAVQNLILAARSRGLGTTLTTLHKSREADIKAVLGIPDDVETVALIPVGYPKGKWGRPKREPAPGVTHWNHWTD